ncbi:hypothetical protein Tsubulata_024397 [Turnera subulata]|uniref:Amino acid transporter transmembrane domain-containing protein n=1 Tax=Turnera subulata TaxID=218843 RepID=A0A9Q0F5Z1_9ROSI|nr:hypothetical protein Tsubulata_024397 [Turnera subulata]
MSPAAGVEVPLLPKSKAEPEKRASISGAVFNVATSIMGAGIMSIPATFKVLGVIPALALILLVAWLVDISVEFMLRHTHSGEATTYGGLMREAFGPAGSLAVQICVLLTNIGCLIIYLIIIGDVLSGDESTVGSIQEWLGVHWWDSRAFTLLFILIFVMFPLVMFRRIESLSYSSAVSTMFAMVFVGICSVMAIYALIEGKTKDVRLLPSLDKQTSFFDLFTAVPVIVSAYTFHFNVHPISNELGKPSNMTSAVRIALGICAAVYSAVGIFGYLLFGESIMPDLLVNFNRSSDTAIGALLNDVIRFTYVFHIVLVFPLLNFPLRANIDEFLFPNKSPLEKDTPRFVAITVVILAFSYTASITIPNIWYFFQFLGSTSAISLVFIFPGAIALRDVHGISTKRDKVIGGIMIILAVITSIIAISSNIYSLTGNKSKSLGLMAARFCRDI